MIAVKMGMSESECINYQPLLKENSVSEFSSSLENGDMKFFSAEIEKLPEQAIALKKHLQKMISKKSLTLMMVKSRKKRAEEAFAPLLSQFPMNRYQIDAFQKKPQTGQYENNIDYSNSKLLREARLLDTDKPSFTIMSYLNTNKTAISNNLIGYISEKNNIYQTKIAIKNRSAEEKVLTTDNRYLSQSYEVDNLRNSQPEPLQVNLNDMSKNTDILNPNALLFEQNLQYEPMNELSITSQSILEQPQNEMIDYFTSSNERLEQKVISYLPVFQQSALSNRNICKETSEFYPTKTQLPIHFDNEDQQVQANSTDKMRTFVGRSLIYTFSQWQDKPSVTFKFSERGEKLLATTSNFTVHNALHENQHSFHCEHPLSVRYEYDSQDQPEKEDE